MGGAVSARTPEQTLIARFYTTHPALQYATAYRDLAARQGLDALQTARLMAMGSAAGADALIACLDAKYTYLAWRPAYAIPRGDTDGNPRTSPTRAGRRCCRRRRTRSIHRPTAA